MAALVPDERALLQLDERILPILLYFVVSYILFLAMHIIWDQHLKADGYGLVGIFYHTNVS